MDTILTRHPPAGVSPPRYGCFAAGWPLLLPHLSPSELRHAPKLYRQPHSSPLFPGLIEHQGQAIPVFDLRPALQESTTKASECIEQCAWVLLFDQGQQAFGLVLDAIPIAVAELQPARFPKKLPPLLRHCMRASFSEADQYWLAIDPSKLGQQLLRAAVLLRPSRH